MTVMEERTWKDTAYEFLGNFNTIIRCAMFINNGEKDCDKN